MSVENNSTLIDKKEREINRAKTIIFKVLLYTGLTLFALFVVIPFYWMVLTALKSDADLTALPPKLFIPFKDLNFQNFTNAFARAPFAKNMIKTVIVSSISTVGMLFTTILASFAFARLNFRWSDL